MKRSYVMPAALLFLCTSCVRNELSDRIISQKFVHKYGFDLSSSEWTERQEDGQVITSLASGVTVTQNFENGNLHGPTTHSFPHSEQIEKLFLYNQGTLLKETLYDPAGVPMREELNEFDDRHIITLWDTKGVPLSIEEYDGDLLMEGKYFTSEHEQEDRVEQGCGARVQRNRDGLLLSRDQIEQGVLTERTTFHPNGEVHMTSRYHDYQLHGPQLKFSNLGRPLLELTWNHGVLDGTKTVYRNGIKVAEVPYIAGERHGKELHFDDLGTLIAEISWRNDKKHGCSVSFGEESTDTQWFFNGRSVSASRFAFLQERERMLAEMRSATSIPQAEEAEFIEDSWN